MNHNVNIKGNQTLNDAIDFLLSNEVTEAKKLIKRADDTRKLVMDTVNAERGIDFKQLSKNDTVTINGIIRFDAKEKNRFNQAAFGAMHPDMLNEFTKPTIEIHLNKL
jgi:hypothetical protein